MIDIAELGIAVDSSQVRNASKDLDNLSKSGSDAEKAVTGLSRNVESLVSVTKLLAGSFVSLKIKDFLQESISLNQRYQELGITLAMVSKNAGLSAKEVDSVADAVRKSGITMIESRQIVTKLVTAQIDLSNATKLARLAQDAAVVGQLNSSQALDAMIHGITSAQVEVLRTIGINVNFEQSYKKLAGEIGTTSGALSEQQKMQARVNVVMEEATKLSGIYEAAMDNAGKQMRSTERLVEDLKVKIGGLFDQTSIFAVTAYTNALKAADSSVENFTQTGQLKAWGDSVARIAAFAADSVRSVGIVFDITGKAIGAMAAQAVAVSKFDFGTAIRIQGDFNKDFDSAVASMSKMRDLVESQIIERDLLTKATERETLSLKSNSVELGKNTEEAKKDIDARNRFIQALQTEVDSIGLNEFAIKRMEAAKLGATKAASPLIDALEEENKRLNLQSIEVNQIVSDLNKYKQVTESVKTDQEKFSDTVEELTRLKNLTNGAAISQETYNRALKKANDELLGVKKTGNETFDALNQYTIQAARNIQTSFANFLFDPFEDGVKGMLTSFLNAIRRMVAEVAASRIANAIGLNGLLGIGGTSATGTASAGGSILSNVASFGSSAFNLIRGGGASLLSTGANALGFTSFGAGASGAASAGVFGAGGLNFLGGAGTALGTGAEFGVSAGLGASMAAVAGPLIAIDIAGRLFGGNKTLGGAEMIPVIGGFLAGLFGHGPMKFRQQSLQGTASIDGFDGDFTNVYRAKGGLFVGNKHKSVSQGLTQDQQDVFDQALDAFYGSAHSFAQKLGLNVDLVDGFTKEFQIKSEKNQQLTAESIQNMLNGVGNDIAKNVLPIVDTFRKTGEDSFATLRRLNDEFVSLENAVMDLGATSSYATNLVSKLSIEQRTGIVEMAGGVERLSSLTGFFAENFLTNEERFGQANERLQNGLKALGIQTGLTNDQFKAIIQSLDTSNETRIRLLELAPVLLTVNNYLAETTKALDGSTQPLKDSAEALNRLKQEALELAKTNLSNAFSILQRTVQGERDKLTKNFNNSISSYNERINVLTNSIGKLRSFVDSIKSTVNDMRPMELDKAKSVINEAIKKKSFDSQELQFAIGGMKNIPTQNFTNSYDYNLAKSKAETLISELGISAEGQLTNEERQLKVLNDQKQILEDNYKNEMNKLDSIIQKAQDQIDKLSGIDKSIFTLVQAIGNFNRNSIQAGTGLIGSGNVSGNANISNKEIVDFANAPGRTDMDIYNAAKKYGVSFEQYAQATGKNLQDLYKWAASKGLPTFESGGFHSGGARIVGEKGPEMEFTGPSNIISNKEMLKMFNNDSIVRAIGRLYELMEGSYKESRSFARTLRNVTQGGNSLITTPAV